MTTKRSLLIVGGGTAGWLAAAYLARYFGLETNPNLEIRLVESPEIGVVGVGEGTFPTIRSTLKFLGLDEARFMRSTSATFKQGIRFTDWVNTPRNGAHEHYFHPFEAPFFTEGAGLLPYWLLQDEGSRKPFAEAITFQKRVADARRAPKRPHEGDFAGPLNYAYHFDAARLADVLSRRARDMGVRHDKGTVSSVSLRSDGTIAWIETPELGRLEADLFIDCTGFRAQLIGDTLQSPFKSVRNVLFTDRALACKVPYDTPDAPIESFTVATGHEAGWTWDIGLDGQRGVGYVYSSGHTSDERAEETLRRYLGHRDISTKRIDFDLGYREQQWIGNCVAVGLSAGFLEPLESTGIVLIEVAVSMIAEFFAYHGPAQASAARFNQLMTARYDNIINFLKLHYCLSRREEPFWRENTAPVTIPERLRDLLEQWKFRPPSRFDFTLDQETFAFFNYQYILYGMGFKTDISSDRERFAHTEEAARTFERIRSFGERATLDLPSHRALIRQIYDNGFAERAGV